MTRLSHIIRRDSWDQDSPPAWLWHAARVRDMPAIKSEGLLDRPSCWLASSEEAAAGFHGGDDTVVLRVQAYDLQMTSLVRDRRWDRWLEQVRTGKAATPPFEFLTYLIRLTKWSDPEKCRLLKATVGGGNEAPVSWLSIRQALSYQISCIKPGTLWTYQDLISPEVLSVQDPQNNFFVRLEDANFDWSAATVAAKARGGKGKGRRSGVSKSANGGRDPRHGVSTILQRAPSSPPKGTSGEPKTAPSGGSVEHPLVREPKRSVLLKPISKAANAAREPRGSCCQDKPEARKS